MKEKDPGVKWFNTAFYPQNKTARAVFLEEKILPRLRQKEIVLFTPWGPRYSWEKYGPTINQNDVEIETLKFLAEIMEQWQKNLPDRKFCWLFLGADIYGVRINKLPADVVQEYFLSLNNWLKKILSVVTFRLWSEFDSQAEIYRQYAREKFTSFVSPRLQDATFQTARAMGRSSDPKEYLVERLSEAMLIEEIFRPIKISSAARYKDDEVDRELPRLYFLPERLQAPWL